MATDPTATWTTMRLRDGRRLAYSTAGPRGGCPVLYLHGAIGCSLDASPGFKATLGELGVRWLAVHRPGFGASDRAPERSVLDFAQDVRELTDALGYGRFAIVAVSAGGPYGLGIARELPERVLRIAAVSSLSPLCPPHATPGLPPAMRLSLALLARAPQECAKLGDRLLPIVVRHPGLLGRVIALGAPEAERARLRRPHERLATSQSFLQAASAGVHGMVDDYLTYSRQWGFAPGEVAAEVHLWHGMADRVVPIEHALQLAAALPQCRAFLDPDEGHHYFRRRHGDILAALMGRDRPWRSAEAALGARLLVRPVDASLSRWP